MILSKAELATVLTGVRAMLAESNAKQKAGEQPTAKEAHASATALIEFGLRVGASTIACIHSIEASASMQAMATDRIAAALENIALRHGAV